MWAGRGVLVRLAFMRMIGPVESYRGFGPQDHLCWVHVDRGDYRPRLTEFSAKGWNGGFESPTWALGAPGNCENISTGWLTSAHC